MSLKTKKKFHTLTDQRCHFCRRLMVPERKHEREPTQDHLVPLSRGGYNIAENRVFSCRACNSLKGRLTAKEFEMVVSWLEETGRGVSFRIKNGQRYYKSLCLQLSNDDLRSALGGMLPRQLHRNYLQIPKPVAS